MSEETLFTAARRLVRNLNVDFPSGLISQETEAAAHTLQLMIDRAGKSQPPSELASAPPLPPPRPLAGEAAEDLGVLREGADAPHI